MDKPTSRQHFLTLAETSRLPDNPTSGQNLRRLVRIVHHFQRPVPGATSIINGEKTIVREPTARGRSLRSRSSIPQSAYSRVRAGAGASCWFQPVGDHKSTVTCTCISRNTTERESFSLPRAQPIRQRSEYGFTLGAPIVRNRLFAFGNVDRTKSDGENNYLRDLILASDAAGPWLTRGNDTSANRLWIQSVLDRFPSTLAPNDPRSTGRSPGVALQFPRRGQRSGARRTWPAAQLVAGTLYAPDPRSPDGVVGEQAFQKNRQHNLGAPDSRHERAGRRRARTAWNPLDLRRHSAHDTPSPLYASPPVGNRIIETGHFPITRPDGSPFVYNLPRRPSSHRSNRLTCGAELDDPRQLLPRSGRSTELRRVTYHLGLRRFFLRLVLAVVP